jgi:CelD/BcsL family acetyltransferase involved in cellulose biosynthesis
MSLDLLVGSEAEFLLKDRVFQQKWGLLYRNCSWATPCQSVDFVTIWYEVYQELFQPVLLIEMSSDGNLVGLLTLALTIDSDLLVFAGAEQAEYQTWLATIEFGDVFMLGAMGLLAARFPTLTLVLRYLPPLAPRNWLRNYAWANNTILTARSRPLLKLGDGEHLRKSLRKSGNKSRISRLKRLGEVRLEHLHTRAELAEIFDETIAYYDLRQGAVNNSQPFQIDSLKKPFHLALMNAKDLLNVAVLRVGDRLVAAHIGLSDAKQCIWGIPVHSPFYAAHSPGKLLLLMVGIELVNNGFETIDLTPGGDPYKDRFATDYDTVYILTICLNHQPWQKFATKLKREAKSIGKKSIVATGIDLTKINNLLTKLSLYNLNKEIERQKKIRSKIEYQIYFYKKDRVNLDDRSGLVRKDFIEDLFLFQPVESAQKQDFLSLCLERFEAGGHIYTWVEDRRLVYYCWSIPPKDHYLEGKGLCYALAMPALCAYAKDDTESKSIEEYPEKCWAKDTFEPGSAIVYDWYWDSMPQSHPNLGMWIDLIIKDILLEAERVYTVVLADNPHRDVIEQAGFIHLGSILEESEVDVTEPKSA